MRGGDNVHKPIYKQPVPALGIAVAAGLAAHAANVNAAKALRTTPGMIAVAIGLLLMLLGLLAGP